MPLRRSDPFQSRARELDPAINPYVQKLVAASDSGDLPILFGDGLRGAAGDWRSLVVKLASRGAELQASNAKLFLEIGSHKGRTITDLATQMRDALFIGMDITFKRVTLTAQRLAKAGAPNACAVLSNAQGLAKLFAPSELDGVLIFFPDPWVNKKRQAKNRLLQEPFAQDLHQVLKPDGFCWLKTDQATYFEEARSALLASGFKLRDPTLASPFDRDYTSSFEERFKAQGLPRYCGVFYKSGQNVC